MNNIVTDSNYINCKNEYGILQKVIVCEPQYMEIKEIINNVQLQYKKTNIDRSLAIKQHRNFVKILQTAGIEVNTLPTSKYLPEQVFTRDIGFSIGNQLFISKMAKSIRQGEEKILANWVSSIYQVPFKELSIHSIEGGDVLVDGDRAFIGLSNRTSIEAIHLLQHELLNIEILPIMFNPDYLHLDCVFNILSPRDALIYSAAFNSTTLRLLSNFYNLIEVSEQEQFTMGTNILSIGSNRLISLSTNVEINYQLRKRGYEIFEVDFSEIIKSGGSFRCCTLPLVRDG